MVAVAAQGPEALTGGAGWVGTGLLGAILAWLLFIHLPAKDKQLDGLLKFKDEQIKVLEEHKWQALMSMSTDHRDQLKALGSSFEKVCGELTAHCDRELDRLVKLIERNEPVKSRIVEGKS